MDRPPLHPDAIRITREECHALWFAFQTVEREFVNAFRMLERPDIAHTFGLGFRLPGTEEAFVPTKRWNALYLKLAELGLEALPKGENVKFICGHGADEHAHWLVSVTGKVSRTNPKK